MVTEATDAAIADKPIVVSSAFRGSLGVVVVGAGGNGARVVPPLTQMLRPGDRLIIVDHDTVEDRNLVRQHFHPADVGQPKALVLANRYRKEHVMPTAFHGDLATVGESVKTEALIVGMPRPRPTGMVVFGCVDNAAARRDIAAFCKGTGFAAWAWIDVGNETRGGQVILTASAWPFRVAGLTAVGTPVNMFLNGMGTAMPQLLRDTPEDAAPSCRDRLDMQTVQVNHMAASAAINVFSWLTLGIPFTSCGAFFSTLNTMQPIRIVGVREDIIIPDRSFAIPGDAA